MEKVKDQEHPGKGLQCGMRRHVGGRKSMKRTEIRDEMKHHENLKINAKENNSREKEARGTYVQHNANLKRWRNQKCKLLEEKELLGKCDGLATAHTHTFKQDLN